LGRIVRGMKAPDLAEVAVNALTAHKLRDPSQRLLTLSQDAKGTLLTVALSQLIKAGFDAGGHLPPIARAAAPASLFGVYHKGRPTPARSLKGGMQACVARTDHQHIYRSG
jgi:hypothetical protein